MDLTVIVDPFGQQGQDGLGIWEDDGGGVVPFEDFDEGLDMPLICGLRTGVKSRPIPNAPATCAVCLAI